MPAGLSGQDKDGLPRGATGDAKHWSPLAPREFWETSVLSFMVKVCGHQAEEVVDQSGMETNRKLSESRVKTSRWERRQSISHWCQCHRKGASGWEADALIAGTGDP